MCFPRVGVLFLKKIVKFFVFRNEQIYSILELEVHKKASSLDKVL